MPRTSTNLSESTYAVYPTTKVVAVVEKTQAMSGKMDMETRVMQVISISAKDHREASTANIKYTLSA